MSASTRLVLGCAALGVALVAGPGVGADGVTALGPTVHQVLPPVVPAGGPFAAEVVVTNPTGAPVDEVYLSGTWSPSHTLGTSTPPPARSEGRVTWLLGRLAAGEHKTVRLSFVPAAGGPAAGDPGAEFRSEFEIGYRSIRTDVRTAPLARSAVGVAVAAPQVAVVGQPLTLRLDLKNSGAGEAKGVILRSTIPDALRHPKGPDLEAEIGVIAAGYTEVVPLVVTPTRAGLVTAVFRLTGDGLAPAEATVSMVAIEANLGVQLHGPRDLPHGWPGTYEVIVRNNGDHPAVGVVTHVAVPAGFTDLRATPGAKLDPAANTLVWPIGDLPAGAERKLIWLGLASREGDATVSATTFLGTATARTTEWLTRVSAPAGK